MSRDWRLYLEDMLTCCEKFQRYTTGMSRSAFFEDERTLDPVLRNLEIVGEAAKKIPEEIRSQGPSIPWRRMTGMRDWIAHAYFDLDQTILWEVVEDKIPELESLLRAFRATSETQPFGDEP